MNHPTYPHLPVVGTRVGAIAEPGDNPKDCAGTVCRIVSTEGRTPYALVNMDDHTTAELHWIAAPGDAPGWFVLTEEHAIH